MVIPIRDENPTRRFPVVTVALIAVNLFVFFALQLPRDSDPSDFIRGISEADELNYEYGAIPCELTEARPLDVAQFVTQQCAAVVDRPSKANAKCSPTRTSISRSCSRCSCTARSCTCSGTCCSCGSSATTSRTASAPSGSCLLPVRRHRGDGDARRVQHRFDRADDRRVGCDRRRDGRVHRLVAAREGPQPDPDRVLHRVRRAPGRGRARHLVRDAVLHQPERRDRVARARRRVRRGCRDRVLTAPVPPAEPARSADARSCTRGPAAPGRRDWDPGFGGGYPGRL